MDEKAKAFVKKMQEFIKDKELILREETQVNYYETCNKCNQQYITGTIHICPTWTQNKKK